MLLCQYIPLMHLDQWLSFGWKTVMSLKRTVLNGDLLAWTERHRIMESFSWEDNIGKEDPAKVF